MNLKSFWTIGLGLNKPLSLHSWEKDEGRGKSEEKKDRLQWQGFMWLQRSMKEASGEAQMKRKDKL